VVEWERPDEQVYVGGGTVFADGIVGMHGGDNSYILENLALLPDRFLVAYLEANRK